jgi:hypothetical protein
MDLRPLVPKLWESLCRHWGPGGAWWCLAFEAKAVQVVWAGAGKSQVKAVQPASAGRAGQPEVKMVQPVWEVYGGVQGGESVAFLCAGGWLLLF